MSSYEHDRYFPQKRISRPPKWLKLQNRSTPRSFCSFFKSITLHFSGVNDRSFRKRHSLLRTLSNRSPSPAIVSLARHPNADANEQLQKPSVHRTPTASTLRLKESSVEKGIWSTISWWLCVLMALFPTHAVESKSRPVVVIGAGPGALFFALRTLQSDPTVHVALYDKSAAASDKPAASDKSSATDTDASTELSTRYTYALGERARLQLDAVPSLYEAVIAKGERSIVPGRARETVFITRDALRHALLTQLKKNFPRRAKCFFNHELVSCDLDARALYLRGPKGKEKLVRDWKLLVGADGADSVVRAHMLRHCPRVRCSAFASKRVRKLLRLPIQPADALFSPGRASFIEQPQGLLRGPVVGAATAERGGGYLVVLSWDGRDEQPWGVRTAEELKRQLLSALPGLRRLEDVELEAFLRREPMRESYVVCSDYCDEDAHAVLLGDAAHAAYSMLWQGCTTAFEDASELNAQLGLCASDGDLTGALRRYSQLRQPEGKAMSDLNLLAHLRFGKSRFFWPRRQSLDKLLADVTDAVNDPEQLYRNVAWSHFAWLALAKLTWMLDREPLDVGTGTETDTEPEVGTEASTQTAIVRATVDTNTAGGVVASVCEPAQGETSRDLVIASA